MRIPPTICVAVRCVVAIGHEKFAIGLKFSDVLSMIRGDQALRHGLSLYTPKMDLPAKP